MKSRNPANNGITATVRAGDPNAKKDYCSHQADQAGLEALLPGITHGDYVPTIDKVALETGAHLALVGAAASTAIKYAIRSDTGVAMSTSSKIFGGASTVLLAITGVEALNAVRKEYKACM